MASPPPVPIMVADVSWDEAGGKGVRVRLTIPGETPILSPWFEGLYEAGGWLQMMSSPDYRRKAR